MKGTWLLGATGMVTLVMAVMLMAYSAPASSAQQRGPATKPAVTTTALVTKHLAKR
jgi:hypothetical protein